MQFDERLKKLRQERGVTQKELAEAVYVSRSAVAKWENGLGLPNAESLSLLAKFFGVEEKMLMTDPEVETVIVGKNGILSRQKILIISLSIMLFLITVVMGGLFASGAFKTNVEPFPSITRELIFETEKELDTAGFPIYAATIHSPVYSQGNLTPNMLFPATREFYFGVEQRNFTLPALCIRIKNGEEVTYEPIDPNKIYFSDVAQLNLSKKSDYPYLSDGSIKLQPVYVVVEAYKFGYAECFNIYYDDMAISVKVSMPDFPAESIRISDAKVRFAESIRLSIDVFPIYASNVDYQVSIDKIEFPDGSVHEEDISEYAYLGEYDYLYTTEKIPLGAKIHVSVHTEEGLSGAAVVEVVRVPVDLLWLSLNGGLMDYLKLGESYSCTISVFPANATFNAINEFFDISAVSLPEGCLLEQREHDWLLTITDNSAMVGQRVVLNVTIPEGKTLSCTGIIVEGLVKRAALKNFATEEWNMTVHSKAVLIDEKRECNELKGDSHAIQ